MTVIAHDAVSLVLTSCGRLDLLQQTIDSFRRHNTYPLAQAILIEDSGDRRIGTEVRDAHGDFFDHIICNRPKLGQIASIDRAYREVTSPYIFHCEDDWLFFREAFIEDSMAALTSDHGIVNVWLRELEAGRRSSRILNETRIGANGARFHPIDVADTGNWHGFTFNPGLRRTADYARIAPFAAIGHEFEINVAYWRLGYYAVSLEQAAVRHLGHGRSESKKERQPDNRSWRRLLSRHR